MEQIQSIHHSVNVYDYQHTIEVNKKLNRNFRKMYIAAVAKAMGIKLPNKVKLVTPDAERMYTISGFNIGGIKIEKTGD